MRREGVKLVGLAACGSIPGSGKKTCHSCFFVCLFVCAVCRASEASTNSESSEKAKFERQKEGLIKFFVSKSTKY